MPEKEKKVMAYHHPLDVYDIKGFFDVKKDYLASSNYTTLHYTCSPGIISFFHHAVNRYALVCQPIYITVCFIYTQTHSGSAITGN